MDVNALPENTSVEMLTVPKAKLKLRFPISIRLDVFDISLLPYFSLWDNGEWSFEWLGVSVYRND